jgi:tetratricopeptide (TPR) repeat protein
MGRSIIFGTVFSAVLAIAVSHPAVASPIALEPAESSHGLFEQGLEKLKLRQYRSAIAAFSEAIRRDPTFTQAYSGRGFAHYRLGNLTQAFADYQQIIRIDPTAASGYSGLALVQEQMGNRDRAAADALKSAALQAKQTARAVYQSELNFLELNQAGAGVSTQEPNWNLVEQGNQRMAAQDYHGAVALFTQAIGKVPSDQGRPYLDRGVAYLWLKDYPAAIADFSKTIELNPYSIKAFEYRAQAYRQLGNRDRAEADLQKSRAIAQQFSPPPANEVLSSQSKPLR